MFPFSPVLTLPCSHVAVLALPDVFLLDILKLFVSRSCTFFMVSCSTASLAILCYFSVSRRPL